MPRFLQPKIPKLPHEFLSMVSPKKKLLEKLLRLMARLVLRKYTPRIVGITGSVGKSSAKEAIALVLAQEFSVRKSEGNYNNEIGIPLTIIGARGGGASWLAWLTVGIRWLAVMALPLRYPKILVLEMGIDRPGDMDKLLDFVSVQIAVVTHVSGSHLAFFGSLANIAKEKARLPARLPEDGYAILNADDKRVLGMREKTRAKAITYGFAADADLRADHAVFTRETRGMEGWSFKLNYDGKTVPIRLPRIVARHHIGAALAAAAVGAACKIHLVAIASALEKFEPLPGRLRLLPGRDALMLLDDTYNASPASMAAAFITLGELQAPRKIVILGDMLELGTEAAAEHAKLAPLIVTAGVHSALLVGQHMRALYEALLAEGFSRRVLWLSEPTGALEVVATLVRPGDLVLIKGSRGMRMERITAGLLANPQAAERLLCCQSTEWRNRPFSPPAEWTLAQSSTD